MKAQDRVKNCLISLLGKYGNFSEIILKWNLIVNNSINTAQCNHEKLEFNEEFILSLDRDTLVFLCLHEMAHVFLGHFFRLEKQSKLDHNLTNIAADHAANLFLKSFGITIPKWAYCESRFNGMIAEKIFTILYQEKYGPSQTGPSQTGPSQTGPSQTGPSQTGPSQTGPV